MLPVVASENAKAWATIQSSRLGDRMKRALQRIAGGESYRQAAEAEGYATHSDIFRYATKYGLIDIRTKALLEQNRKIARLSGEEIQRRLLEKPEDFNNRDLVVANGVSVDKIMAHERRDDEGGSGLASEFEKLAAKLAESGASMEIQVAVRPTDPVQDAVDVTPPRP
jgi:hypothetical protein